MTLEAHHTSNGLLMTANLLKLESWSLVVLAVMACFAESELLLIVTDANLHPHAFPQYEVTLQLLF